MLPEYLILFSCSLFSLFLIYVLLYQLPFSFGWISLLLLVLLL